MTTTELQKKLYEFIQPTYSDIKIEVVDTNDNIRCLYFTDEKFITLFPRQRYHYLVHSIPDDFYEKYLQNTTWFELAPGENPDDLNYHDQEIIDEIKDIVLQALKDKIYFVSHLDNKFTHENVKCSGDFRHSKKILGDIGISEEDQFDIFHVLMDEGAYCDCEILYNVFRESEYSKKYWLEREE